MQDVVAALLDSPDPSISYRAHRLLAGLPDDDPGQRRRRDAVARSGNVRRMLGHRGADGRLRTHAYKKWQGPHWVLAGLAELGHPPGDDDLLPMLGQVHDWLFAPKHLLPPSSLVIAGQEDRVRRCASQEGMAVWYSVELGLSGEHTDDLVERLVSWQWPDGGWNCDRTAGARTSSVVETLIPLRGLVRWLRERPDRSTADTAAVAEAVGRAAEFLLARRLLWRARDGAPITPDWGSDPRLIQWPVRLYDVLSALVVMAEAERLADPRCTGALDLLASKRLPDGGFPVEVRTATTADRLITRGTFADWGPAGRHRANPFVTIDALWVLSQPGRPN